MTSQVLEVVDEQVKAMLFNNNTSEDEEIVGEDWKDKYYSSSSSNYLLRKMKRNLVFCRET